MGEPVYLLQIVNPQGVVVRFPGGGPMEKDIVEACVKKIAAKYVGLLKTQKQVEARVREAVAEAIYELKAETIKVV